MPYPNDANGDTLRELEAAGEDLTRSRDVEFYVDFADGSSAEQFAEHFRRLCMRVVVDDSLAQQKFVCDKFPWTVFVFKHMVPTYAGISNFEILLQSVADRWGGRNSGWGWLSDPPLASS